MAAVLVWGVLRAGLGSSLERVCVVFRACPSALLTSESRATTLLLVSQHPEHVTVRLGI